MATNVNIQGLSGAGFRAPVSGGYKRVKELTNATVDIDDHKTQLLLAGERDNFIRTQTAPGTFTVSSASPAVFSKTGHGLVAGDAVIFSTTGALYTGLTAGKRYFVITAGHTTDAFEVSATYGGAAVNTSGSQSGVHTVSPASVTVVGTSRRGFRIPQISDGAYKLVKTGGAAIKVDLSDARVRRILYRSKRDWISSTSTSTVSIRGIQNEQNGFDVKIVQGTEDETVVALDSNANNAANTETVVVGTDTYTFKTALTEAKATDTLVSASSGDVTAGDTVNVNGTTYTFRASVSTTANEVLVDGTADGSLDNLIAAINGGAGSGVKYGSATVAHATVTAGARATHTSTLTAKTIGTAGNAYTLVATVTASKITAGAGTFSGGLNSVANEVKVGGSGDASLTNLSEAINAGANAGTDYSTATVASTEVTASALDSTATLHNIVLTKLETSDQEIAVSTTAAHLTVSNAEIQDPLQKVYRGVTAVVDPSDESIFQALRRYYKLWIEA